MSNYIKVLKRLEQDKRPPTAQPTPPADLTPLPLRTIPMPVSTAGEAAIALPTTALDAAVPAVPPTVLPIPVPLLAPTAPQPVAEATIASTVPVARAPEPALEPTPVRPLVPSTPFAVSRRPRPELALATSGIPTLLENLRMLANGRSTRTIVFAGASVGDGAQQVAIGLAEHASRNGSQPFVAELAGTAAQSRLVPITNALEGPASSPRILAIDLDAGVQPEHIYGWIAEAAPRAELVILMGPPLATSIDSALLARGCDGLVIVAESEVTERAALQVAADRARVAGCRTLGVVMHGTKEHVPSWIHRLIGGVERPVS